jgi:hypothetical protein
VRWGDVRKEAIDIYDHIDKKELRERAIWLTYRSWGYEMV